MIDDSSGALAPRTSADTTGEVRRVLAKLESGGTINLISMLLANADRAFRPYILMSNALMHNGRLDPQIREILILWMAGRLDSGYEVTEHRRIAAKAGVSEKRQRAALDGQLDSPLFSAAEKLALAAAKRVLDGPPLEQEQWTELVAEFGVAVGLEIMLVAAWWGGFVPTVIRGLEIHGLAEGAG